MISFDAYRRQWTDNVRGDLLFGLVVALAAGLAMIALMDGSVYSASV